MTRAAWGLLIALVSPLTSAWVAEGAHAQQPASPRLIGVVWMGPSLERAEQAFKHGLRDAGHVEGRDISFDWWQGGGDYGHVSEAVAGMVQRKVDVIVVAGTPAALAAQHATTTIPIVMALVADPVGSGLVASLARPGGNVTGLSAMAAELSTKRLQLLKEAIPRATRVGIIFNPDAPYNSKVISLLKAGAPELEVELTFIGVRSVEEFRSAFTRLNRSKVDALMILDDAFMATHEGTILQMASKARLPVVYGYKPLASQGALISYAPDFKDLFRRAAGYVDKILKGASPASLPVEQPNKFDLVVNLRTANTLGLTIPESVLIQADEVIR